MALLQVGENRRAERELKNLGSFADKTLTEGILALASLGPLPSLAVRLDRRLFPNGGGYDGAAYPLPDWPIWQRISSTIIPPSIREKSSVQTYC